MPNNSEPTSGPKNGPTSGAVEKGGSGAGRGLLAAGVIGTIIAALCCFTPVLVGLLGVVGLSAVTGYLDLVLLPALIFFIGLTLYAVWRRRARANS